jgi:hypothetical protein
LLDVAVSTFGVVTPYAVGVAIFGASTALVVMYGFVTGVVATYGVATETAGPEGAKARLAHLPLFTNFLRLRSSPPEIGADMTKSTSVANMAKISTLKIFIKQVSFP